MWAISFFYILFLILIIILVFIILLHSGYHTRTLIPPLLDTFYGVTIENGSSISSTTFNQLYISDHESNEGISSSINFGNSFSNYQKISFRPMWDDGQRKLKGTITLLMNKLSSDTDNLELRLRDEGDNSIVGDSTIFNLKPYDKGLTEVKLYFKTNNLENNNTHNLLLEGKSINNNVNPNNYLINSSYLYYY